MLAGVLAGVVLGPSVLGRLAPELSERTWDGAIEQRIARDGARRDLGAQRFILSELDPAIPPPPDALARTEAMVAAREAEWRDARRTHRIPLRVTMGAVVIVLMLSAGRASIPRPPQYAPPGSLLGIGGWAAAIPAAIAIGVGTRWLGLDRAHAILAGLRRRDRALRDAAR